MYWEELSSVNHQLKIQISKLINYSLFHTVHSTPHLQKRLLCQVQYKPLLSFIFNNLKDTELAFCTLRRIMKNILSLKKKKCKEGKFINNNVLPPRSAAIKTRGIAQLTSTRYAKANEPSIAPNLAAIRVTAIAVPRTDVGNSSIPVKKK